MKHSLLLKLLQPLATLASGIGKQKKLFILIYHRVLDEPDFMRPGEVDKVAFTWQMELLSSHFNVLPLSEALERMQNDTLPPRAVCITFDDGYADNYTNALPILKQFNLTATFFIASGFLNGGRMWNDTVIEGVRNLSSLVLDLTQQGLGVFEIASETQKCQVAQQIIQKIKHLDFTDRALLVEAIAKKSQNLPDDLMMTTEQLKKLHKSGMEIGGHTVSHPILAKLDQQSAELEIIENKTYLENLLNIKLNHFAYPNGKLEQDYLPEHVKMVKNLGYRAAVTTQWGVSNHSTDPWQLSRFTPWDNYPVSYMMRLVKYWLQPN